METISQRTLRNDNAEILRAVVEGQSFVVTRRGVPVGRLVPMGNDEELPCDRPARQRDDWDDLPLVDPVVSTKTILDDLRDDR